MNHQCTFIVPCYKETPDVIIRTVEDLTKVACSITSLDYEIIVVNDGMRIDTFPSFADSHIQIINHDHNLGYGASLMSGILKANYEWIGIIDADGTYPASDFERLFEYIDTSDMVVGCRRWQDISFIRRIPKYILQKLASFIADFTIPDLNSGMRLFKKEIALKYRKLFPKRYSFTTTITMICITNFYNVKFLDIPYYKRIGHSGIKPVRDTLLFFSLIFRLGLYFKPLRFFIPLSGFCSLLAVGRGLRDVIADNHFGGLTLILCFMAFQIFFFGLIAEIINKKL
ncbi:MAG: glycosyltransferase family 2 protein [Fibrobacter sp.]|nr:glycosyltransferase family 2 protein [Fibrobacter sp.]